VKFRVYSGGLQLSSALKLEIIDQSKIAMVSSTDVQFYSEGILGLGSTDTKQKSPDHYSYDGENSHKSCADQEDIWVIKFRSGQNLFDLIML